MLSYNDLYELLRKEKYSEVLQVLPKNFVSEVSEYLNDRRDQSLKEDDLFADNVIKSKKQLENSIALFRELMRIRKKKILNLVFVATETGMMKRDYENMLSSEKEVFDSLVKAFEEGDKQIARTLHNKGAKREIDTKKMIIFNQTVEQFVDMTGKAVGPFNSGDLVNLDSQVSGILVSSGKADFVDEE